MNRKPQVSRRDPMAKALALGQYRPKATPPKVIFQRKREEKHKSRLTEH